MLAFNWLQGDDETSSLHKSLCNVHAYANVQKVAICIKGLFGNPE